MLLSLLVYSLTAILLCLLGWHVAVRDERFQLSHWGRHLPFYSWEIVASVLLIAVIAGARWHTGFDHEMYLDQYRDLVAGNSESMGRERYEWGFVAISRTFAWMHAHYFFYFAFWGALQAGFLYFGLRKHKFLLPWVGLNLMMGIYFLDWCNSMRQAVVICVFVAMVPLIVDRSWRNFLIYVVVVCVMSLLHRSAFLLLPVYLLAFVKADVGLKRGWCIAVLVMCLALGLFPGWWFKPVMQAVEPLLKFLNYDIYQTSGLLKDLLNDGYRFVHFGPLRVSLLLIYFAILWFYPSVARHFRDDRMLRMFFLLALIGMCLENLLINTSHFILRPTEYFLIFVMILNAYTLSYLWRNDRRLVALILMLVTVSYVVFAVYKANYMPTPENRPFLYHFFFMPQY